MPLQTAPATITVAVTGGNTVFTLVDLSDTALTYRAATVGGEAVANVQIQPVLTITRRRPSASNPNTKYNLRLVTVTYDYNGNVVGRDTHSHDFVAGEKYVPASAGASSKELFKALNLVGNDATILAALSDNSWFR